jgi:hypothetical protein
MLRRHWESIDLYRLLVMVGFVVRRTYVPCQDEGNLQTGRPSAHGSSDGTADMH